MSKKKHKNRVLKSLFIILLVMVVLAGVILAVNYKNLMAFYKGITTDVDTLSEQLDQNKQNTAEALNNSGLNVSEDDISKLNDGTLTKEEITELLLGSMTFEDKQEDEQSEKDTTNKEVIEPVEKEEPGKTAENTETKPEVDNSILTEQEYNKKIAELVAQVYVIQANFNATLNQFESNIISYYKGLPEEQRTTATKAKIVADNMSYVAGLEAQCDAQIKEITDALTKLMTENNKDTSLVDAIKKAYANEKELKKAYYISLYK